MVHRVKAAGAVICIALLASGCVSSRPGANAAAAPVDDAAAKCAAAAIGGAVIGTLIGAAAAGNRGAGAGALIGGAVGGVGCAVLTALDRQDKERIRNAQIAAAATNQPRYLAYQGADGKKREITIRPQKAEPQVAEAGRICRAVDTSATIAGTGSADLPTALVCRTSRGDWVPA